MRNKGAGDETLNLKLLKVLLQLTHVGWGRLAQGGDPEAVFDRCQGFAAEHDQVELVGAMAQNRAQTML
jgi:hypothetical protein